LIVAGQVRLIDYEYARPSRIDAVYRTEIGKTLPLALESMAPIYTPKTPR